MSISIPSKPSGSAEPTRSVGPKGPHGRGKTAVFQNQKSVTAQTPKSGPTRGGSGGLKGGYGAGTYGGGK